jgi:ZIP family zinc transporter
MDAAMTPLWAMVAVGLLTGAITLLGGSIVLRYRPTIGLLLGFSSGAVIGVALFDLLPEGLDLLGEDHSHFAVTSAAAAGFVIYLFADRLSRLGGSVWSGRRHFGPASLTMHSLLDGLGMGFAFHVSLAAGLIVAVAILAHDFIDGANTVVLSLAGGTGEATARGWLAADATAPLVGLALASALTIPPFPLALLLGLFAGFFLYVGASELLPRSQSAGRPQLGTIAATGAGMAFIYGVVTLASI